MGNSLCEVMELLQLSGWNCKTLYDNYHTLYANRICKFVGKEKACSNCFASVPLSIIEAAKEAPKPAAGGLFGDSEVRFNPLMLGPQESIDCWQMPLCSLQ